MNRPIASLSLDLDNKWSYMKTHGDAGWETFPTYLNIVVPRFLSFLQERSLNITVFVVGQDAALDCNRDALESIPQYGHEIGNHSFHHEPWLHLYSKQRIHDELGRAEESIERVTGEHPCGFRGPGFSLSEDVLRVLSERKYVYDCSTFPTFLGPLARLYYFMTARLDDQQKEQRSKLFGTWSEGYKPLRPYQWTIGDDGAVRRKSAQMAVNAEETSSNHRLVEIPVTTMPWFKVPIHVSYLLYLDQFSSAAAMAYWKMALTLCRLNGVAPSLLLHPLDFLGCDDDSDLSFFPAMRVRAERKIELISRVLESMGQYYDIRPMREHAGVYAAGTHLGAIDVKRSEAMPACV